METNVIVTMSCVVPVICGEGAVQSFVEKIARDTIVDIIHNVEKDIEIVNIAAISKDTIKG